MFNARTYWKTATADVSFPCWNKIKWMKWMNRDTGVNRDSLWKSSLSFYISKTNNSEPFYFSHIPDTCLLYPTVINLIWNNEYLLMHERKYGVSKMVWNWDVVKTLPVSLNLMVGIIWFFCKDLTNIVSYILSKNEYLAIFHFKINPNFS